MIKGIVFNQAFWIQKTDDVTHKLSNYGNLQNQVNSLQSFKKKIMSQSNISKTFKDDDGAPETVMLKIRQNGDIKISLIY